MSQIIESLESRKIISDVIDSFVPSVDLKIEYNGRSVKNGEELKPGDTIKPPVVEITGNYNSDLFSLVVVDPDAPSPNEPSAREWVHWVVTNIPGATAVPEAGNEIVPYSGPTPPIGIHRYVFVLFKQPGLINVDPLYSRMHFNTRDFSTKYRLGLPVAAAYFVAQKQSNVGHRRRN